MLVSSPLMYARASFTLTDDRYAMSASWCVYETYVHTPVLNIYESPACPSPHHHQPHTIIYQTV